MIQTMIAFAVGIFIGIILTLVAIIAAICVQEDNERSVKHERD